MGGLFEHLKQNGIEPALALKAGLLSQSSSDSSKFFDRFRNRLIFPIRDERRAIVAFGGRVLSQDEQNEPKYLNSPETPVYHREEMLYQYSVAREACRQVRQMVLVEGYMDLLAFHAQGFLRVAATLGTALTSQQVPAAVQDMRRSRAGLRWRQRRAEGPAARPAPVFAEELSVSCTCFRNGLDPDDFLKKFGLGGA